MTNGKAFLVGGLASMAIFASTVLGGAPMGPPMALLGEGNWGAGGEYGHGTMDLQAYGSLQAIYGGIPFDFVENVEIDDLTMNMFFATVGYGVCDNWDIFVRVGAADAQDDVQGKANIPLNPNDPDALVSGCFRCLLCNRVNHINQGHRVTTPQI